MKFTPAARTRTRAWPAPGAPGSSSPSASTSGPPVRETTMARLIPRLYRDALSSTCPDRTRSASRGRPGSSSGGPRRRSGALCEEHDLLADRDSDVQGVLDGVEDAALHQLVPAVAALGGRACAHAVAAAFAGEEAAAAPGGAGRRCARPHVDAREEVAQIPGATPDRDRRE